jgi:hypothetical protein
VYNFPKEGLKNIPYKWIWRLERVDEKDDELMNF